MAKVFQRQKAGRGHGRGQGPQGPAPIHLEGQILGKGIKRDNKSDNLKKSIIYLLSLYLYYLSSMYYPLVYLLSMFPLPPYCLSVICVAMYLHRETPRALGLCQTLLRAL